MKNLAQGNVRQTKLDGNKAGEWIQCDVEKTRGMQCVHKTVFVYIFFFTETRNVLYVLRIKK